MSRRIPLDVVDLPKRHPLESTSYSRLESCARKRFLRMWATPKPKPDEEISPRRARARLVSSLDSGESLAGKAVHDSIAYCMKMLRGTRTRDGRVTLEPRVVSLDELMNYAELRMRHMLNYSEEKTPELIRSPWFSMDMDEEKAQAFLKNDLEHLLGLEIIPADRRLPISRGTMIQESWKRLWEGLSNWYQYWFLKGDPPLSTLQPEQILNVEGDRGYTEAISSDKAKRWDRLQSFIWEVPIGYLCKDQSMRRKGTRVKHLLVVDMIVRLGDRLRVYDWKTDRLDDGEVLRSWSRSSHREQKALYYHYMQSDAEYKDCSPDKLEMAWVYIHGEVRNPLKRTDIDVAADILPVAAKIKEETVKLLSVDAGRFEDLLAGVTREEHWPKTQSPSDCALCNYKWIGVCGGHDSAP